MGFYLSLIPGDLIHGFFGVDSDLLEYF